MKTSADLLLIECVDHCSNDPHLSGDKTGTSVISTLEVHWSLFNCILAGMSDIMFYEQWYYLWCALFGSMTAGHQDGCVYLCLIQRRTISHNLHSQMCACDCRQTLWSLQLPDIMTAVSPVHICVTEQPLARWTGKVCFICLVPIFYYFHYFTSLLLWSSTEPLDHEGK